jgi:hypothetical protein
MRAEKRQREKRLTPDVLKMSSASEMEIHENKSINTHGKQSLLPFHVRSKTNQL